MNIFARGTVPDDKILSGILGDSVLKRATENKLYEQFAYLIKDATFKHQLTEDDAASLYADAILVIIEHIQKKRFEGKSSLKTYLFQIFSNKCVDFIRKTSTNKMSVYKTESIDDLLIGVPDETSNILQEMISENEVNVLKTKIKQIGEKCQEMMMSWSEGLSDEKIAVEMGYQSAGVVKTSRLRCLEKLRALYK
ncbi:MULTISPECIES: sigma-70 family RNA polymerase sigma factor [unclassified Arcicella]|uniref:RNA polymerase sigma factor n=1 Tax=unclassified Arcicella TaxID=2644986 RepID=UPI0028655B49|nr:MULTISPECIES: sigma-70 family RNA polymerase sigma factor [unclassified Arcicella]MDR6564336.1 RNA polymerase sigma-70 factor (ECF subfamily) [Arcicella sp. BE51]MDR6814087.1 RNA polymerase sigma-70 factor (ECF subfamily) [Arcicella sp. BE140]MDR6825399.1 RNA polymerase sigma-70 factor (ECF subfamily) [Arcicella sp. BE139]